MATTPLPFDFADLDEQLETRFLERGVDYFNRGMVMEMNILPNGQTITGKVRGSGRRAYDVRIKLAENPDGLAIDGECSCPVGYDCKHVAALLLAALGENETNKVAEDAEYSPTATLTAQRWLEEVEQALQPEPAKDRSGPDEQRRLLYILSIHELPGTSELILNMQTARKLQKGGYGKARRYNPANLISHGLLDFMQDTDVARC